MRFLNPAGLWLLLLIPVLIIIYILRARHEERSVSSTFIWKLSANFMKKRLPFRKMRKILLFACQLLMLAAVALLAARPVIVSEGGAREYVLILDASASMNIADGNGETRFERAADKINDLASKSLYGTEFTVIIASEEASYLVQRTDSVSEIRVALDSAMCGTGSANITEALSLAQELCDENPVTDVIFYTDTDSEEGGNVTFVNVSEDEWNVSFTSFNYEMVDRKYVFTAEIHSTEEKSINVALSADGKILDVKKVACTTDGPASVVFETPDLTNFSVVTVYTDAKDGLEEDNTYSVCKRRDSPVNVLIVSESPYYLENVFEAMGNCTVKVASSLENAVLAGYGLYVFDGVYPDLLPSDGSVWVFTPDNAPSDMALTGKMGFDSAVALTRGNTSSLCQSLASSLMLNDISVQSYSRITAGKSWESIFSCGEDTVLFARKEKSGTKTIVFAFDLHDSNLPLLTDYVLLMRELLNYSFPDMLSDSDYTVAETVDISLVPLSKQLFVKMADGRMISLSTKTTTASMIPETVGVYTAVQTLLTGYTQYMDFFVHLPISEMLGNESSDSLSVSLPDLEAEDGMKADDAIQDIRFWVILALFLLILTEWGVYYYEQF